ncbi:prophage tail fiber N-terminal domain-containing protein [Citrobacter sp. Cb027]|uniref:prophage tail fiber N-terminal domain-containing protein n=1 Tax=Citrobacter sp. Cb027 TaxID=2985023 RepID=UPI00257B5189|nr:prophage tail fiber N-terminal domain-containing protein [Citrobacter sp. Cb027]MDM3447985.1 prophage tail fiber N-terminal domain-containing protein [Citrobacter sp. Cb027]
MPVHISGVLKDGAGKPIQNCTIQLKAKRNSTTVVVNTVASENPDEAGRYAMDVEYGQYSVILLVEGYPPNHAGRITVWEDSKPGTLNDFLGVPSEDDVRPEALRRFEQMVEEVSRQAAEVENNATLATEAAREAADSAARSEKNAESAEGAAQRAEASAVKAAASAQAASNSADSTASDAGVASESAKSARSAEAAATTSAELAGKHESNAAASALSASQAEASAAESASVATDKAGDASNHEQEAKSAAQAAKRSEAETARSEANAALSADAAEQSAIRAETFSVQAASSANEVKQHVAEAAIHASVATQKAEDAAASVVAADRNKQASEDFAIRAESAAERAEDIASAVDIEDASLTRKGVVRLSNETDSDSESEASTPKAVKDVMDETRRLNESLAGKQPLNDILTAVSNLTAREDNLLYFDTDAAISQTALTEKARQLLAQTTPEDMRRVLEAEASGTVVPQSNIYDRSEGVVAIPGTLGYGGYYKYADKVIFRGENGLADFISWVSTTPPGRYVVGDGTSYSAPQIIDKENRLEGIVEIIIPDTASASSQSRADKLIIFMSKKGEMFINWLKWSSAGAGLAGWGNLSAKRLRSADFWGNPGIDGVTLAAISVADLASHKRGDRISGEKLRHVSLMFENNGNPCAAASVYNVSMMYGLLPGSYFILSGSSQGLNCGNKANAWWVCLVMRTE